MGTRCLTIVEDEDGNEILNMYRQMDGYPEGHGKELSEFLKDIVIVNGIKMNETRKIANGMGCLAAQLVAHFKDDVGQVYLMPPKQRGFDEEYVYTVKPHEGKLGVEVFKVSEGKFIGELEMRKGKKIFMQDVDSSTIAKVGFDSLNMNLVVEFINGSTYSYADVTLEEYNSLMASASVGSYFAKNIKDHFVFTKL